MSTTVATFVTESSFFISLSKTYSDGLPFAIASLSPCLQFFTFGFVIPLIGIIIWNQFQTLDITLTDAIQNSLFDHQLVLDLKGKKLINFIFLILYFSFPTIGPIHFQRISMGRNIRQVKTAFVISAALLVFIKLAIL